MKVKLSTAPFVTKLGDLSKQISNIMNGIKEREVLSKRPLHYRTVMMLAMFYKTQDAALVAEQFGITYNTVDKHIRTKLDRISVEPSDLKKKEFFVLVDNKYKYFVGKREPRIKWKAM